MTDDRFRDMAEVVGGLAPGASQENSAAIHAWAGREQEPSVVALKSGPRIPVVADLMAVWTLFIEGLVAALFLLARRRRTRQWSEIALVLFVATTYVLAPVIGFGWVLLLSAWLRAASALGSRTSCIPRFS